MSSLTDTEKIDSRFEISINMSETDRQLYFSDHVIELQNAEDEKRRRIRDARHRAEKAQREAFRDRLVELAKSGIITPETRWRGVEDKVFEDFVYDWKEEYRRDKVTLNRVWEMSKKEFAFDGDDKANVEEFSKLMLEWSARSPDLYGEIRRMSNRENPLSSVHLFFNERRAELVSTKNGHGKKRGIGSLPNGDESSEDEGEIIEDGEVAENG
jgi:pre-mRNA-processing factor 40